MMMAAPEVGEARREEKVCYSLAMVRRIKR
jgi:hypothetical protein